MNLPNLVSLLALVLTASACSTTTVRLTPVREFAAMAGKLDGVAELTVRYRDTYDRERPYLAPANEKQAAASDAVRRAAYAEFVSIGRCVQLYMETLGKLTGATQGDLSSRVKSLVGAIKAWPGSGISTQQASAYTRLSQLTASALTASYQQVAASDMLRDGAVPMQQLLAAINSLLSDYARTADNEKKTVLGLYEVELPFLATPGQPRLLLVLANNDYAQKKLDYGAAGRRLTLVKNNLHAITQAHLQLVQQLASTPSRQGDSP